MDPSRLKNIIFIFILNLILLSGEMAFPSDLEISFLPSVRPNPSVEYSKYWAQEQTGSDLVHKRMANLNFSLPSEEDICVVIDDFDNYYNTSGYHGFLVRNLIIDIGKHSVLPAPSFNHRNNGLRPTCRGINLVPSQPIFSEPPYYEYGTPAPSLQFTPVNLLQEEVKDLFQRNSRGIIINYSIQIEDSSPAYAFEEFLFEHLVEDSTSRFIVVIASGNSYRFNPNILETIKEIYDQDRAIIVGSSSPTGLVSDFSQGGGITILAPSDRHLLVLHGGREITVGGTSGSAPQVTGVLTGFNLISGYKLSVQEAIFLLSKTAIPLLSSLDPENKNGPGLLNAFKIIEIAFRLKELCIEKTDHEKATCFHKGIMGTSNQNIYEFKSEISLASSLNQIQLSCDGPDGPEQSECIEIKRQALEDLRKAAFLNQNDSLLWESLADIYESENIPDNADFYRSVASAIKMMQGDESHNGAASPRFTRQQVF